MDAITTIISTHKTNVEEYNNIMLHKQFSIIKIYQVEIDTKFATNIKHFEP
jgi:succinylglutamate desuccinylase